MRLSLFLSYTASILFVPGGSPIQKFLIWAGLRDTKDPSRLVLQKCAPFQIKKNDIYCSVTVCSDTVQMLSSITKSMFRTVYMTLEILKYIFITWNSSFVYPCPFLLTFKKKDLSPDICHSVKASLTTFLEWGVRSGKDKKKSRHCHSNNRSECFYLPPLLLNYSSSFIGSWVICDSIGYS